MLENLIWILENQKCPANQAMLHMLGYANQDKYPSHTWGFTLRMHRSSPLPYRTCVLYLKSQPQNRISHGMKNRTPIRG